MEAAEPAARADPDHAVRRPVDDCRLLRASRTPVGYWVLGCDQLNPSAEGMRRVAVEGRGSVG
jgi:hypothetical protein